MRKERTVICPPRTSSVTGVSWPAIQQRSTWSDSALYQALPECREDRDTGESDRDRTGSHAGDRRLGYRKLMEAKPVGGPDALDGRGRGVENASKVSGLSNSQERKKAVLRRVRGQTWDSVGDRINVTRQLDLQVKVSGR